MCPCYTSNIAVVGLREDCANCPFPVHVSPLLRAVASSPRDSGHHSASVGAPLRAAPLSGVQVNWCGSMLSKGAIEGGFAAAADAALGVG